MSSKTDFTIGLYNYFTEKLSDLEPEVQATSCAYLRILNQYFSLDNKGYKDIKEFFNQGLKILESE
ncbi:MAG: hypothetical protein QG635_2482 [Bacteroidota bacterium]|nr:hypothetical protein [Bacteroidota bacterium]